MVPMDADNHVCLIPNSCSCSLCYSFSLRYCEIHFTSRIPFKSLNSKKKKGNIFNQLRNIGIKECTTFDLCFKMTRVDEENNQKHII
jgi:hypothetical protein